MTSTLIFFYNVDWRQRLKMKNYKFSRTKTQEKITKIKNEKISTYKNQFHI